MLVGPLLPLTTVLLWPDGWLGGVLAPCAADPG